VRNINNTDSNGRDPTIGMLACAERMRRTDFTSPLSLYCLKLMLYYESNYPFYDVIDPVVAAERALLFFEGTNFQLSLGTVVFS
jgi:hypothetical protein